MSGEKLSLFTSIAVNKQPKTDKDSVLTQKITVITAEKMASGTIGDFTQLIKDFNTAGIAITKDNVTIRGDKVTILNKNSVALFASDGKLNASLIDADTITVNHLWAKSSQGDDTSVGHFGNYDIDDAKISGVGYPLWLGAATAANAPFRVSKDGELYAAKGIFKGEIQGVSGSFTTLTAIDGDKDGVKIYLSSSGQITFDGDIYNQGAKTGRGGWRFYANNIWGRGAFGHRGSTVAVVNGVSMDVYPDGYANTTTMERGVSLESVTFDGKTVYKIPLYSPTEKSSGCPIDVVIFKSTVVDRYYEFVPDRTGKRWIAVNANDNYNTIHFCDAGGWHTLGGGWSINMFYIDPGLLTPSQASKTYLGRGIFWAGEKDLDWKSR